MPSPEPPAVRVSDIMTHSVYTISLDTIIFDAVEQMVLRNVGALVVTDGERPVGIVTERDLLKRVIMGGLQSRHEPISQIYTPQLVTIDQDETVQAMCRKMTDGHFRHLPVMANGVLQGLVSATDLIRLVAGG